MKNKITETDFIGGQGSLTEKEELALKEYFAKKKKRIAERRAKKRIEKESSNLTTQRKSTTGNKVYSSQLGSYLNEVNVYLQSRQIFKFDDFQ